MKKLFILAIVVCSSILALAKGPKLEYYALITYRIKNPVQEVAVEQYLKQALPALHRLGHKNIGVFKPVASDTAAFGKMIWVLIPFASLNDYEKTMSKLEQDTQLQQAGAAYWNAKHDEHPYERIEISLMRAFANMPVMQTPKLTGSRTERVYELRSYESPTEKLYRSKVKMFNAGDEIGLFARLGFNAVFYAEVLSGNRMPNLVYMTTFENMASRDAHWKAFVADPQWKQLLTIEEYKNTVSKADIWLLTPTDYSDY
jgi:hypothetical protein